MGELIQYPARELPPEFRTGHFVINGGTGSGKSFYTKWLIKHRARDFPLGPDGHPPVFVFVSPISADQWTLPEKDGSITVPRDHVFTAWTTDAEQTVAREIYETKCGFVVFDDFATEGNYHGNKNLQQLFRTARQKGVQLAIISHSPHDVPPVVRNNASHAIIAKTSNTETIKDLAQSYLMGDTHRLATIMRNGVPKHTMLVVTDGTIGLHKAEDDAIQGVANVPIGGDARQDAGVGGLQAQARGNVTVGGTYHDHSTNQQYLQLEQNIKIRQESLNFTRAEVLTRGDVHRENERRQFDHEREMRQLRDREDTRRLLYSTILSREERDKIARVVGEGLNDRRVTSFNVFDGYDTKWMALYYPELSYTQRARGQAMLATHGGMLEDVVRGDSVSAMVDIGRAALTNPTFNRMLGRLLPAPAPKKTRLTKAQIRPLLRDRIVNRKTQTSEDRTITINWLNRVSHSGTVTNENFVKAAAMFMRKHYPDDLKRITQPRTNPFLPQTLALPPSPEE